MHCTQSLERCEKSLKDANTIQFSIIVCFLILSSIQMVCIKHFAQRKSQFKSHSVQTDPEIIQVVVHPDETIQLLSTFQ